MLTAGCNQTPQETLTPITLGVTTADNAQLTEPPSVTETPTKPPTEPPTEPTPEPPTEITGTPLQQARALAARDTDSDGVDNSWALWLVNRRNPLPEGYVPELSPIAPSYDLDSRIAPYALLMMEAARNDGITLAVIWAYRDLPLQESNFRRQYNEYVNAGYTRERAFDLTAYGISIPGASEHNAGLAIDFNHIDESFDQHAAFRWLQDNAHEYGFIMRYPKDTIFITGIIYEPWHWRYLGVDMATRVKDSGLTFNEFYAIHIK